MTAGKLIGKGNTFISELNQTYSLEAILCMSRDQFKMLLSFCTEKELQSLYVRLEGKEDMFCVDILTVLGKI